MIILNNNGSNTCYCYKKDTIVFRTWWTPLYIHDDGKITVSPEWTNPDASGGNIMTEEIGAPVGQYILWNIMVVYLSTVDVSIITQKGCSDKIYISGRVDINKPALTFSLNGRKLCIVTNARGDLATAQLFYMDTQTYADVAQTIEELRPNVIHYGQCLLHENSIGKLSFDNVRMLVREGDSDKIDIYVIGSDVIAVHERQAKKLVGVKWAAPMHTKPALAQYHDDK